MSDFHLAVLGEPEDPNPAAVTDFLDRITSQVRHAGRPVTVHMAVSHGPLFNAVAAHCTARKWTLRVRPDKRAAVASCELLAVVPGIPDRRTWDVVEEAAERNMPVRVLTRKDLPKVFLNSPHVQTVEPSRNRTKAGDMPTGRCW